MRRARSSFRAGLAGRQKVAWAWQELVALGQRAEAVRVAMENARTKLLKEHAADMAAAKATLSSTLDAVVTHITDLLDDEVTQHTLI